MKNYIKQFYNEGFATTFYLKPINYLKNRVHNKKTFEVLSNIIKFLYTALVLLFAGYILYKKLF